MLAERYPQAGVPGAQATNTAASMRYTTQPCPSSNFITSILHPVGVPAPPAKVVCVQPHTACSSAAAWSSNLGSTGFAAVVPAAAGPPAHGSNGWANRMRRIVRIRCNMPWSCVRRVPHFQVHTAFPSVNFSVNAAEQRSGRAAARCTANRPSPQPTFFASFRMLPAAHPSTCLWPSSSRARRRAP